MPDPTPRRSSTDAASARAAEQPPEQRKPWLADQEGGRVDPRAAARPATAARAGDEYEERPISDDKPRGGLLSRLRGRGSDDRSGSGGDTQEAYADPAPASHDTTGEDASDEGTWVHHDGTDGHEGWLYHYADGTIVDADGTVYELTEGAPGAAADHDASAADDAERERAEKKAEREKAGREKAEREKAERAAAEKAERDRAEREQAAREEDERKKAEREQAERERAEKEEAERKQAEHDRAEREKDEREQAEREKAEREKAERDHEERSGAEGSAATAATIAAAGAGTDTDERPTEEAQDDRAEDERSTDATAEEATSTSEGDESGPATQDGAEQTDERAEREQPTKGLEARRTSSVPSFVEYSPSEAPRYALGAVAALAAVGAVLVGFSAVADSSGSDLVLAAVLALVAAAALWLLERWSSTVVTVRDSTLEVERRGSTDSFDLRDPDLAVDLDEDQRSPSWSATFAEPEGERVTLRRTHVKVAQFVEIVEHHRSHLHERD